MKEFLIKHPIISLLLGSTIVDGAVKIVRTIAYAKTGREGLAPNTVSINWNGNGKAESTIEVAEEETEDEPAGDIQ